MATFWEIRLREAAAELAVNSARAEKVGLTDQQKAKLRHVAEEAALSLGMIVHDNSVESVRLLSPAQRQKLQKEIDGSRSW